LNWDCFSLAYFGNMNDQKTRSFINQFWDDSVLPCLTEYVKIPNQSPAFDKAWESNGFLDQAAKLLVDWVLSQKIPNLELELLRFPQRTPLIFITIPATPGAVNKDANILLYGHLDKQPPLFQGWEVGLGPYSPVIRDGKLFGRGASDDGYAIFSAISSIRSLKEQGVDHGRCVLLIEACEESGSPDLPFYMDLLSTRIGIPSLIVCLDSGCGNYEQFWLTTSLRGLIAGDLKVHILKEGVHSGLSSGVVPSSFRILRSLLSRLEDENTGRILSSDFYCQIPEKRLQQAKQCAEALGSTIWSDFPFVEGAQPMDTDPVQLLLNKTWNPMLSITGAEGFPTLESSGNVLRPFSAMKLSLRLPPLVDASLAQERLRTLLESNPPYNSQVSFKADKVGSGWDSPLLEEWLETSVNQASVAFFDGKPANYLAEGGSIPFMGMLGRKYPKAQFIVTGNRENI